MSRHPQPAGTRGSLRWMQTLVNEHPNQIDAQILRATGAGSVEWVSPLESDDYAEYRDRDAVSLLGAELLDRPLADFWPVRGPQWDGLGRLDDGGVVLVEAKAHIDELFSQGTQASEEPRKKIVAALEETRAFLGADTMEDWAGQFYQYCNRLAHLYLLRVANNVPAWLVNCYFVGDEQMSGPSSAAEWQAAIRVIERVLGLGRHPLKRFVVNAFVPVWLLENSPR